MPQHDLILLAIALAVILGVVVAIARFRMHPFPALVIGALVLGLATGSATVAIVTTSGLMAATVAATPGLNPSLLALSIGAGSLFFSHINDAGFWLVKEYMGMSLPDMFKTWSALETIVAVMGLLLALGLSAVI